VEEVEVHAKEGKPKRGTRSREICMVLIQGGMPAGFALCPSGHESCLAEVVRDLELSSVLLIKHTPDVSPLVLEKNFL
jgi:hypothetical protein